MNPVNGIIPPLVTPLHGGANIFPELFTNAFRAAKQNDADTVVSLQSTIESLQRIYEIGKYASGHIKVTKNALAILGICDDVMAEPFHN